MNDKIILCIVAIVSISIMLIVICTNYIYRKRVEKQLIHLSEALESHIMGQPIQPFSEVEDILLSKIQKQLITLDNLWTERYIYEKKEKERLNSLISDIAHQIKTPLANIKLYESLLESTELTKEEQNKCNQKKIQQMNKLEWLMEALVKVSKMETGMIQLHKKEQLLSSILLQAIDMVTPKAEYKNINISYHQQKEVYIKVDEKWMTEAIFNIVDNGVKYSNKGSNVTLTMKVMQLFVRIDIEDEGITIPEDEYNHIFERFYRRADTTTVDGVGLGLYMSRDIITRHEGYIIVEKAKKGNLFSVFLPL